jgi:hypothetical protein
VKLWSYADLMGLRIIYWMRQQKTDAVGAEVPATSMNAIRRALECAHKCVQESSTRVAREIKPSEEGVSLGTV